ncbi:uncharacterized protein LOC144864451 [Branchiostoma floridae x Branchiostoma japonicum]
MCFLLAQIYQQISVSATTAVPAATTDAVGLWPLNARFGASDITGNGNDGTATGTQLAAGPYGDADGAFLFSGTANSYIDIPNNGKLDVRYSFTILAHVYPTGEDGPIFDYVGTNPNTWYWALHFWQYQPHDLQLRPVGRDGPFSDHVVARVLQLDAWNYVGGTYDSTTGVASLWSNGELAREQYIGVTEVASQHPVRVAVRAQDEDDPRYFAGRIACLQLYNYAMSQEQIVTARDVCKGLQSPALRHTDDGDADHKPTSCAEAKSVRSNTNDGEYTLYPFSTDSDVSLRVYCHDMASEKPKEFLTLPSGPDENYAIFFGDRLVPQNMFQCTGPLQQPFARRGTTKFSKLRIQFHTSRIEVIGNDYTFAQTTGPNDRPYGYAGDCYSAAQGCAKGTFKVDLIGTGLALAPEVHWVMAHTYPGYLTINDMYISEDRKGSQMEDCSH